MMQDEWLQVTEGLATPAASCRRPPANSNQIAGRVSSVRPLPACRPCISVATSQCTCMLWANGRCSLLLRCIVKGLRSKLQKLAVGYGNNKALSALDKLTAYAALRQLRSFPRLQDWHLIRLLSVGCVLQQDRVRGRELACIESPTLRISNSSRPGIGAGSGPQMEGLLLDRYWFLRSERP